MGAKQFWITQPVIRATRNQHNVKLCETSQGIEASVITMDWARFILKVLIVSTGLAAAIKYFGPTVFIPTNPLIVLVIVLMPTAIVAVALLWRISKTQQLKS